MGPPYIYPPVRTTVLLPDNDFLYIGLKTPSPEKRKSMIESHFLQKKGNRERIRFICVKFLLIAGFTHSRENPDLKVLKDASRRQKGDILC